jgi:predicted peroxiredoxin
MKVLSIVESAYRATVEEQDDTILWINTAMKGAGADVTVLLKGNAVNYAVKAQDASGLVFGSKAQTKPPQLAKDVERLIERGVAVHVVRDDVAERGIESSELIEGLFLCSRTEIAELVTRFDQVWHW